MKILTTSSGLEHRGSKDGNLEGFDRGSRGRKILLKEWCWEGMNDFPILAFIAGWMLMPHWYWNAGLSNVYERSMFPTLYRVKYMFFTFLAFSLLVVCFSWLKVMYLAWMKHEKYSCKWKDNVIFLPIKIIKWFPTAHFSFFFFLISWY